MSLRNRTLVTRMLAAGTVAGGVSAGLATATNSSSGNAAGVAVVVGLIVGSIVHILSRFPATVGARRKNRPVVQRE